MIKRTPAEILVRMEQANDLFGTEKDDLLMALPFEQAKPFLKEGTTETDWLTAKGGTPLEEAMNYLPFAWGKASDRRGLSAMRSMYHFNAWLWLLGADVDALGLTDYTMYGKPELVAISVALGFDWAPHDQDGWANDEVDDDLRTDELVVECVAKGEELKAMLAA